MVRSTSSESIGTRENGEPPYIGTVRVLSGYRIGGAVESADGIILPRPVLTLTPARAKAAVDEGDCRIAAARGIMAQPLDNSATTSSSSSSSSSLLSSLPMICALEPPVEARSALPPFPPVLANSLLPSLPPVDDFIRVLDPCLETLPPILRSRSRSWLPRGSLPVSSSSESSPLAAPFAGRRRFSPFFGGLSLRTRIVVTSSTNR